MKEEFEENKIIDERYKSTFYDVILSPIIINLLRKKTNEKSIDKKSDLDKITLFSLCSTEEINEIAKNSANWLFEN